MKYSDDDKAIARQLCKEKTTLQFLEKLFAPNLEDFAPTLQKNVVALDDAEYGRLMKVLFISRVHFKDQLEQLRVLGAGRGEPVDNSPSTRGVPR